MSKRSSLVFSLFVLLSISIALNYFTRSGTLYTNLYFFIVLVIAFMAADLLLFATISLSILHFVLEIFFQGNLVYAAIRIVLFVIFAVYLMNNKKRILQSEEKEIKYDRLFDNMPQAFAVHKIISDNDGNPIDYTFLCVNPAFEEITGLKANEIIGKRVKEILPNTEDYWIKTYGEVAFSGKPARIENYSSALDKYFDVRVFSLKYGEFAVVFTDITNRVKTEKELIASREVLKEYIDNAPDGVIVLDIHGKFRRVNKAIVRITGFSEAELLTMRTKDITPFKEYQESKKAFEELFKMGKATFEVPYIRKSGEQRIWSVDAVKTNQVEAICFIKDVTARRQLEKQIEHNYYHDSLTGLHNRVYVYNHMQKIETEANYPLAIILADINGLKLINDAFGKDFGDEVIKKISHLLATKCGHDDILARWGGDEFIIISPNGDENAIHQLIDSMQSELNSKIQSDLSVSFGFHIKTDREQSFEKALNEAEDMMLRYKTYESSSFRGKTIKMILSTLHEKNSREEQHSKRVSEICESIGRAMNFTEAEVGKLKTIGLVHDIGKIGIHENILNKSGKLTNEEWEEIKKHPEIGYRLLSSTNETAELANHVLAHHERIDGRGYPKGLTGKDLSILTKILTIADSYDAMTSKRTYREIMPKEAVIAELRLHSGTQFDPVIVELFITKVLPYNNFM